MEGNRERISKSVDGINKGFLRVWRETIKDFKECGGKKERISNSVEGKKKGFLTVWIEIGKDSKSVDRNKKGF